MSKGTTTPPRLSVSDSDESHDRVQPYGPDDDTPIRPSISTIASTDTGTSSAHDGAVSPTSLRTPIRAGPSASASASAMSMSRSGSQQGFDSYAMSPCPSRTPSHSHPTYPYEQPEDADNYTPSLRVRYNAHSSTPGLRSRPPSISTRAPSTSASRASGPDLFRRASSARTSIPHRTTLHETAAGAAAFRKPRASTQLRGEIEKPWLKYKDPAHRWAKWIFWGLWAGGCVIVAVLCYLGWKSVPNVGKLCMVLDDDFGLGQVNPTFWEREVRLDGYGFGQFEWTTDSPNNSYIQDNTLFIVPTLTRDVLGDQAVIDGYRLNLTADGTCTSNNVTHCVAASNASMGTVINPVQVARLKSKMSMRYGKVEVVARLPEGDWLQTGIKLLPTNNTYGPWPRSGEIGLVNARGNPASYSNLGNDYMHSALHWGPFKEFDSYFRTWGIRQDRRNSYTKQYKTYALEWNDKYLATYIDNKVQTILDVKFGQPFWEKGDYPAFWQRGEETVRMENPWYTSDNVNAPFDQDFHLILSLSVGGTSGFFPDNLGGKPWQDSSAFAMTDFWTARDRWLPTWNTDPQQRALAIKSVKMWRVC